MGGLQIGLAHTENSIEFPERTVVLARGSLQQLASSVAFINCIAEFRLAKETAYFFDALPVTDQRDWVSELLERTQFNSDNAPRICILDTGVNRGHPLLEPLIEEKDCFLLSNFSTASLCLR
jgi:hypothetical protein